MVAANYPECENRVLAHEGSRYTDGVHPYDPGGPTRWGITIADARMYWKKNATADDVRTMPREVAVEIYRKQYWAPVRGDDLLSGIDDAVFDYGVNSGIGRSGRVLRHVLGLPDKDWRITDEVIAALKKRDSAKVINAICDERMRFLQSLKIWPTYRTGWTIRVREVREFSLALAGADGVRRAPSEIPSAGMGKGKPPAPTTPTTVNVGAGTGLAAALAAAAQWIEAHPAVTVVIVGAVVVGVVIIHNEIKRRHRERSTAPMPGTEVVPMRG